MGKEDVTDRSFGNENPLCDATLMAYCYDLNARGKGGITPDNMIHYITGTKIRFYTIDKEDDLYNSAFQ